MFLGFRPFLTRKLSALIFSKRSFQLVFLG